MQGVFKGSGAKLQRAVVIVVLMGMAVVGCSTPPSTPAGSKPATQPTQAAAAQPAQTAQPAAAKPKEYQIGFVSEMTGTNSFFHKMAGGGAELAAKEINDKGGINGVPIKIMWEDGQCSPRPSVTAFQKLRDVYNVPAVMASCSSVIMALHPLAKESKTLLANVAAVSPRLRALGQPLASFVPTGDAEMPVIADMMLAQGLKEAAVMHADNDFGNDMANAFVESYQKKGGKVLIREKNPSGATDMRTQLLKIKGAAPKAMFINSGQGENGYIVKQAREIGLDVPIFGETYATTDDNFQIAGAAMNGMQGARIAFVPDASAQAKTFVDKFRSATNGSEPDHVAAISYDIVNILAQALKTTPYNGESLYKAMLAVKDYPGAMSSTTIGADGFVISPPAKFKVEGGKVVNIK